MFSILFPQIFCNLLGQLFIKCQKWNQTMISVTNLGRFLNFEISRLLMIQKLNSFGSSSSSTIRACSGQSTLLSKLSTTYRIIGIFSYYYRVQADLLVIDGHQVGRFQGADLLAVTCCTCVTTTCCQSATNGLVLHNQVTATKPAPGLTCGSDQITPQRNCRIVGEVWRWRETRDSWHIKGRRMELHSVNRNHGSFTSKIMHNCWLKHIQSIEGLAASQFPINDLMRHIILSI